MKKKVQYLDYACKVNERVQWTNIKGEKFEGYISKWSDPNDMEPPVAIIKLDDGTEMEVVC